VTARPMPIDDRASALATRRDELLTRLPCKLGAAARLAHADRELVVDDAIAYTVMEHPEPLWTPDEVERVFWTACEIRVKRTLDGRHNTVRNGWQRVGEAALVDAVDGADPVAAAEESEERRLVIEFAATLGERERRVLRVKYFSGTAEPLGYKKIARQLGITIAAARAADRAIERRVKEFAAIYAAGDLCPTRELEISALAVGTASRRQVRLAQAHVAHCMHCHASYAARLRAMRSAAFERKVAALLPAVEAQNRGRLRGAWDAIADTATRPFGHDTAATAAQLAASGAGRGAGTIAMLKLAGACMASATAVGVCATTLVIPALDNPTRPDKPARKVAERESAPVGEHDRLPSRAEQHVIPTPTPTPKPARSQPNRDTQPGTQGGTGPGDHEQTPASPAPANAAAGGESEFDPTYEPSSPSQPAPVQAAPGRGEFF
jgi:hypothetical protein